MERGGTERALDAGSLEAGAPGRTVGRVWSGWALGDTLRRLQHWLCGAPVAGPGVRPCPHPGGLGTRAPRGLS